MTVTFSVWWIPAIITIILMLWPVVFPYRPSGMFDFDMRGCIILPLLLLTWLVFFAVMYFCK